MLRDSPSSRKKQNQSNAQTVQLTAFHRPNGPLAPANDSIATVQAVRLTNRQNQPRPLPSTSRNWLAATHR